MNQTDTPGPSWYEEPPLPMGEMVQFECTNDKCPKGRWWDYPSFGPTPCPECYATAVEVAVGC